MLRDRLVYKVNHQGMQRKLLSKGDLMYDCALKLALIVEASEWDFKKLGLEKIPRRTYITSLQVLLIVV